MLYAISLLKSQAKSVSLELLFLIPSIRQSSFKYYYFIFNKDDKFFFTPILVQEKLSPVGNGGSHVDWEYAQSELLEREGVDLKLEMEQKMREMEEQWRKEKEEASQAFQVERKKYEDQIESLQKQVHKKCLVATIQPKKWRHSLGFSPFKFLLSSFAGFWQLIVITEVSSY